LHRECQEKNGLGLKKEPFILLADWNIEKVRSFMCLGINQETLRICMFLGQTLDGLEFIMSVLLLRLLWQGMVCSLTWILSTEYLT
jgi:hypothetical protein